MVKKVLITGANGFLGSSLWKYFKAKQSSFRVFGIDLSQSKLSSQIVICDLNNQKKVSKLVSRIRPDYIFHLAGGRVEDEKNFLKANIMTTKSLLEVIAEINSYSPRIIIPGSAAEYGKTVLEGKPVRESVSAWPVSFYGFVKNAQTNLGLMYARFGLDVAVARIFNVCGHGMPPSLSLGHFSKQIISIKKGNNKNEKGLFRCRRCVLSIFSNCSTRKIRRNLQCLFWPRAFNTKFIEEAYWSRTCR